MSHQNNSEHSQQSVKIVIVQSQPNAIQQNEQILIDINPMAMAMGAELIQRQILNWQQMYNQKLNQYYEQLQRIKYNLKSKRIKGECLHFSMFIFLQLLLTVLKHLALINYDDSSNISINIQILTIFSCIGFFYFVSTQLYLLGYEQFISNFLTIDVLKLVSLIAIVVNVYTINLLPFGHSQSTALKIGYTLWILYSAGTVRIQVSHFKWAKAQIILAKIVHLVSFSLYIIAGFKFIHNGNYRKISELSNQTSAKYILILYFASNLLFFRSLYSMVTKFDGTDSIRFDYIFENKSEQAIRKKQLVLQKKFQNIQTRSQYQKKQENYRLEYFTNKLLKISHSKANILFLIMLFAYGGVYFYQLTDVDLIKIVKLLKNILKFFIVFVRKMKLNKQ